MPIFSIIGTLLALAFALCMLWCATATLLASAAETRDLCGLTAPWRRWTWPTRPCLYLTAVLIWLSLAFVLACRLARLVMAA